MDRPSAEKSWDVWRGAGAEWMEAEEEEESWRVEGREEGVVWVLWLAGMLEYGGGRAVRDSAGRWQAGCNRSPADKLIPSTRARLAGGHSSE